MLVPMAIGYTVAFFGVILLTAGWRELYWGSQRAAPRHGWPLPCAATRNVWVSSWQLIGEGVIIGRPSLTHRRPAHHHRLRPFSKIRGAKDARKIG